MTHKYEWYTIRYDGVSHFDVHGFYEAPPSSVLAGQMVKNYIISYATLEEAQAAYPDAQPGSDWSDPVPYYGHLPDDGDY